MVGFDERCDVVEFDCEEGIDEEALWINGDDDAENDADDMQPGIWRITRVRK